MIGKRRLSLTPYTNLFCLFLLFLLGVGDLFAARKHVCQLGASCRRTFKIPGWSWMKIGWTYSSTCDKNSESFLFGVLGLHPGGIFQHLSRCNKRTELHLWLFHYYHGKWPIGIGDFPTKTISWRDFPLRHVKNNQMVVGNYNLCISQVVPLYPLLISHTLLLKIVSFPRSNTLPRRPPPQQRCEEGSVADDHDALPRKGHGFPWWESLVFFVDSSGDQTYQPSGFICEGFFNPLSSTNRGFEHCSWEWWVSSGNQTWQ